MHYYLTPASSGMEPPGVWVGAGARALGLFGLVNADVMKDSVRARRSRRTASRSAASARCTSGTPERPMSWQNASTAAIAEEIAAKGPYITDERREEITRA